MARHQAALHRLLVDRPSSLSAISMVVAGLAAGCTSTAPATKSTYVSPMAAEAAARKAQVQWVGPQQASWAANPNPPKPRKPTASIDRPAVATGGRVEPEWPTPNQAPRTAAPRTAAAPIPNTELAEIRSELKRTNALLTAQATELEQARAGQGRLIEQQDALLRAVDEARLMAQDAARLATSTAATATAREPLTVSPPVAPAAADVAASAPTGREAADGTAQHHEAPVPAPTIAPALADALRAWSAAKANYEVLGRRRTAIETSHADGVTPQTDEETQTLADLQKQMRQAGRQAVAALGQVGKFDAEQRKSAAKIMKDDEQLPAEQRTLIATLAE